MSKIYLTIFISDIPVSEAVFHEGKKQTIFKMYDKEHISLGDYVI
jgi:hypothetical protein